MDFYPLDAGDISLFAILFDTGTAFWYRTQLPAWVLLSTGDTLATGISPTIITPRFRDLCLFSIQRLDIDAITILGTRWGASSRYRGRLSGPIHFRDSSLRRGLVTIQTPVIDFETLFLSGGVFSHRSRFSISRPYSQAPLCTLYSDPSWYRG